MDITAWMDWFLAAWAARSTARRRRLRQRLDKARFWERIRECRSTTGSGLVLNRLLDGFEGKLTTSKYAKLAKCSQDTALRDILALVEHGVLVRNPEGGRSTAIHWLWETGRHSAVFSK